MIDMYRPNTNINRSSLLQGDIISQVHVLGAINLNSISYLTNNNDYCGWQITNAPIFADVMILSHSCEISLDNKVKVTSIILAPIRDVNTATRPEKIDQLRSTNNIDEHTSTSFLKYYYLEPNEYFSHKEGAIVDFSKLFSVRKQSYNTLLENKIVELEDEYVYSMSRKLSLYFYRNRLQAA